MSGAISPGPGDGQFTILVNGRKKSVVESEISYKQVVGLAFETPPYGDNTLFTIAYRNGPPGYEKGILAEGEFVKIQNGMIFDVTATDKS